MILTLSEFLSGSDSSLQVGSSLDPAGLGKTSVFTLSHFEFLKFFGCENAVTLISQAVVLKCGADPQLLASVSLVHQSDAWEWEELVFRS